MAKPEEFDSSILLLAEVLVIWADCGGSLEARAQGWDMEQVLNLARVLERRHCKGQLSSFRSFRNKHPNWGHHG